MDDAVIRLPPTATVRMQCRHTVEMSTDLAELYSAYGHAMYVCDPCYVRRRTRGRQLRVDVLAAGFPGVSGGTARQLAWAQDLWEDLFSWFCCLNDFYADRVERAAAQLADSQRADKHERAREVIADMQHRRHTLIRILCRATSARWLIDMRHHFRDNGGGCVQGLLTEQERQELRRRCFTGLGAEGGYFVALTPFTAPPIPIGEDSTRARHPEEDTGPEFDWEDERDAVAAHQRSMMPAENWWDYGNRLPDSFSAASTDQDIDEMVEQATAEVRTFIPGQLTRLIGARSFLRRQRERLRAEE